MPGLKDILQPSATPDFKQIVEKTLAVFAVFTGATLTFYVKDFLFSEPNRQAKSRSQLGR